MDTNIYYERLKKFWESKGFKDANEFAKSLGYDRSENISRLERKGKSGPGIKVLTDIVKKYPDFDFNFFLTGKNQPHTYESTKRSEQAQQTPASPYRTSCKNPQCLSIISELEARVNELLYDKNLLKTLIEDMKREKESEAENKHEGGVEEPRNTG
jgi:hypothetical protein